MGFRYDINGLRAIAVIAVMIFHFDPTLLPGGFAGVDVFFVISGFLMTRIIFRGFEFDSFNLLKFYVARANRIIPALTVVCFVLLVFGWFYLLPSEYRTLGAHIGGSVGFVSNFIYSYESGGYFNAASKSKWLLHTWSLSVEWQFYIVYPLLLILLNKVISLQNTKYFLLMATFIGFFCGVYLTFTSPKSAYFLLSSRAWEMMLGGIAYLYPVSLKAHQKKPIEVLGFIFIICSYLLISNESAWPGYLALFPTLGVYLVLVSNCQNSIFTRNHICQAVGKWSYSIYLWHWPVVVFGYYFNMNNWLYIGFPISVLFGFLSFVYIESLNFRSVNKWANIYLVKPLYICLALGVLGSCTFLLGGGNNYLGASDNNVRAYKILFKKIIMPERDTGYCFYDFNSNKSLVIDNKKATNCILGRKQTIPNTLLFGSSYAGMYDPFLDIIFKKNNQSYNSISTNWCSPILTSDFTGSKHHISYKQCLLNRNYLANVIDNKSYKNIILVGMWDDIIQKKFIDKVEGVIKLADAKGINVIILPSPTIYIKNTINVFYRELLSGKTINLANFVAPYKNNGAINKRLENITNKYKHAFFVQKNCLYNDSGLFKLKKLIVPYTLDGEHISELASHSIVDKFLTSSCYHDFTRLIK